MLYNKKRWLALQTKNRKHKKVEKTGCAFVLVSEWWLANFVACFLFDQNCFLTKDKNLKAYQSEVRRAHRFPFPGMWKLSSTEHTRSKSDYNFAATASLVQRSEFCSTLRDHSTIACIHANAKRLQVSSRALQSRFPWNVGVGFTFHTCNTRMMTILSEWRNANACPKVRRHLATNLGAGVDVFSKQSACVHLMKRQRSKHHLWRLSVLYGYFRWALCYDMTQHHSNCGRLRQQSRCIELCVMT